MSCVFSVMLELIRHPVPSLAGLKELDSGFRRNDNLFGKHSFMD
jgi:hypothetical protein